ncbi:transposase domain-containing protein [Frankia sp. QA3]|uniref:transposase domain-containing protein n=1 Tax=Frankia sp. QA3 TaxID=710111 RepID=UPI0003062CA7|nr:transposase domain-containing protein [Frankia sp. QA3]
MAVWLLLRMFPARVVDRAVEQCGRGGQRNRLLPPRVVVHFVLAMCLFPGWSYPEIVKLLAEAEAEAGVRGGLPVTPSELPTTAAVSRARARLGPDPLKVLYHDAARMPAGGPGSLLAGAGQFESAGRLDEPREHRRRTVTLDVTALTLPDSPQNLRQFDGSRPPHDTGSRPQARLVGLTVSDSRRVLDATVGSTAGLAPATAQVLAGMLRPADVLMADGALVSPAVLAHLRRAGVDVLWRVDGTAPAGPDHLPDGSYLSTVAVGPGSAGHTVVRVLGPAPDAVPDIVVDPPGYLVTTLLDPHVGPRDALLSQYLGRWTIRDALGAPWPGSHRGAHSLRSRWPEGVEQELWGVLLVQHALRMLTPSATEAIRFGGAQARPGNAVSSGPSLTRR